MNSLFESVNSLFEADEIEANISDLHMTNGNYHNNATAYYGRVHCLPYIFDFYLLPYDGLDFPMLFKAGSIDIKELLDFWYHCDSEDDWVKFQGRRVQVKDLDSIVSDLDQGSSLSYEYKDAIEIAVNKAIYGDDEEGIKPMKVVEVDYE